MATAREPLEIGEKLRWARRFDEAIEILAEAARLAE